MDPQHPEGCNLEFLPTNELWIEKKWVRCSPHNWPIFSYLSSRDFASPLKSGLGVFFLLRVVSSFNFKVAHSIHFASFFCCSTSWQMFVYMGPKAIGRRSWSLYAIFSYWPGDRKKERATKKKKKKKESRMKMRARPSKKNAANKQLPTHTLVISKKKHRRTIRWWNYF